ncbi:MAG TPA: cytochrome P450 [Aeromicrobium sp.]|nr:cytochrome P450 [Aeromicrobium sp.]
MSTTTEAPTRWTRPLPDPKWDAKRFPPALHRSRLTSTLALQRDPIGQLKGAHDVIGPVFTLRVLNHHGGIVCAADLETNREVLTNHELFAPGDAAALIEPIVGRHSLILTPAPKHTRNRKLLMPPFHGEKIMRWTEFIGDLTEQQLPELLDGGPLAVRPWAQRLTLDVILRVVFGIESAERRDVYRHALDRLASRRIQSFLFLPDVVQRNLGPFSPGGVLHARRKAVDDLLDEEIITRRADPEAENKHDVLSVLLSARDEDGRGFTDEEVRDELKGLVVAGHETTATALAWTLHFLAHNPDKRDALIADLNAGSKEYLAATIKESMRLRAPVWDAIRMATRDTILGGQPVPAGALVAAVFSVVQLDDSVWPDPEAFIPERHLVEPGGEKPNPWALTPFGGGARRCIGASLAQLELEIVLAKVLERAVPHPAGPLEPAKLLSVTLVPANGGRVEFTPVA